MPLAFDVAGLEGLGVGLGVALRGLDMRCELDLGGW